MKRNKKAPAMHRSVDDYILTTHLFCGKCGTMMTGEMGTSMTLQQYRYYKCYHVRKKKCDKKNVRKEWIEDLKYISDDNIIEELAEHILNIQSIESHTISVIKTQIIEVEKNSITLLKP